MQSRLRLVKRAMFMGAGLIVSLGLAACVQQMGKTGRLQPLQDAGALKRISGKPPEGTVPQSGAVTVDFTPLSHGQDYNLPRPFSKGLLGEGKGLYDIHCLPCHGVSGYGDGMVVQRGFLAPPSYHIDRLRKAADQHFFDVITHGYGAMYSYAYRVPPRHRWAIVAYIRALQLSQNAALSDLSAEDKARLKAAAPL